MRKVNVHDLQAVPRDFAVLWAGLKNHELRPNDRSYRAGDFLLLREHQPMPGQFTGRWLLAQISFVDELDDPSDGKECPRFAISTRHVILSLTVRLGGIEFGPQIEHLVETLQEGQVLPFWRRMGERAGLLYCLAIAHDALARLPEGMDPRSSADRKLAENLLRLGNKAVENE